MKRSGLPRVSVEVRRCGKLEGLEQSEPPERKGQGSEHPRTEGCQSAMNIQQRPIVRAPVARASADHRPGPPTNGEAWAGCGEPDALPVGAQSHPHEE